MKVVLIDDDELFCSSLENVISVMDSDVEITAYRSVSAAKYAEGSLLAQGSFSAEGSLLADGSLLAEGSLTAEGSTQSADLVLLDYHLPGSKFLDNLKAVRGYFSHAKIAIVSGEDDPRLIVEAIHYGAFGFIPKTANSKVLMAAIDLIYRGQVYLPETVLGLSRGQSIEAKVADLSEIKKRVLKQLITGKANKVIEYDLGIATSTLNGHLSEIFKLFGVRTRTEAVIAVANIEF